MLNGTGIPSKYFPPPVVPVILKRASRSKPASKYRTQKINFTSNGNKLSVVNRNMLGAITKEQTSQSESSCTPKGDAKFNRRAIRPSKKSKIPAIRIKMAADSGSAFKLAKMDSKPIVPFPKEIKSGIFIKLRMEFLLAIWVWI